MKQWLAAAAMVGLCFFSCQKEIQSPANLPGNNSFFFQTVRSQLKDSLSANDYSAIDTNKCYKSKDAQSDGYFVRIAFEGKEPATDFVLLRTDSSGNIRAGKMIHVNKASHKKNTDNLRFQGQFVITSLNGNISTERQVVDGRWKRKVTASSMMEEPEPVGEQDLPDVVVTSYSNDGGYMGDWFWYGGFFDDYGNMGGAYTYGSAGGGGGGSSSPSGNGGGNDNTITIEVESTDIPSIKAEDYIKCFSNVPDANATYQVTILTDIPVDGDPSKIFNWNTNSPGHSFIQLIKTSGALSIQQTFGFYPNIGYKSLGPYPTEGKLVDNSGHEYNASLTKAINSSQFQTTINMLESLQYQDYDISNWNCTDFALSAFNASTYNALAIPQYVTDENGEPMNTPQGLYTAIQLLQASGNTTHGTPSVPNAALKAGTSHGSCKD